MGGGGEEMHTKGPWEADPANEAVFDPKDNTTLADVFGDTREERTANARLIAAAPELLEACKGALAALEQMDLSFSGWELVRELEKVIAKAGGQ